MKRRRLSWEQRHQQWLDTPVGAYESAISACNRMAALGPMAHILDERESLARRALQVATEQGWHDQIAIAERVLTAIASLRYRTEPDSDERDPSDERGGFRTESLGEIANFNAGRP